MDRIVALVDMDCFYVQVEQKLNPDLKGKPCAVVQYTGGGVIAVSYEARAFGVIRGMSIRDVKSKCPDILLPRVPELRGKSDLTTYRDAGAEVIKIFSQFCQCVERASIDEAFLDLTKEVEEKMKTLGPDILSLADQLRNTHVIGWEDQQTESDASTNRMKGVRNWLEVVQSSQSESDIKLAIGGCLVEQMRAAVYEQTGYRCSAGVSCNKMLAKLSAGLHKPNQQTILPHPSVESFFMSVPLRKVRNLGGKLGTELSELHGVKNMSDLCRFTKDQLCLMYGRKTGLWLHDVCRGYDLEPVSARKIPKSIGCSKNFLGKLSLDTKEKVKYWLSQLAIEVEERLLKDKEDNKRMATSMIVGFRYQDPSSQKFVMTSRTCALVLYNQHKIAADALTLLQQFNLSPPHQASWSPSINMLSMSAGKFVEVGSSPSGGISALLKKQMNNPKFATQIPKDFEAVPKNNQKPNDKKPKEKTIQNFFSRQLTSNSTQKYKDEISQCNTQDVLQDMADMSPQKNKTERKPQGFFATKQKQMNSTKKDCSLLTDFNFQRKPSSNGQTQDINHANSNLTISSKYSLKDCMEPKSKALNLNVPFSESLLESENLPNSSNIEYPSSYQQNNSENCIYILSDNETSDVDCYMNEDSNSNQGIFQNLDQNVQNSTTGGTISSDNDQIINLVGNESTKVDGENMNKLLNTNDSVLNMQPTTVIESLEVNSDVLHEKKDLDASRDAENDPDIIVIPNPTETISDISVRNTPKSVPHNNSLIVSEKKQTIRKQSDSNQNSSFFSKNTSSSVCNPEKNQMSLEALDYVTCEECSKKVLVWDFEEHQDFHFAQKLQRSVNSETRHVSNAVPSLTSVKKRKINRTPQKKNKIQRNVQTLEAFFK